jgi:hypothetical protein
MRIKKETITYEYNEYGELEKTVTEIEYEDENPYHEASIFFIQSGDELM